MLDTMKERVASAAKFLDLRLPGWAELIDLDTYDQGTATTCIGGQLHEALGIENVMAHDRSAWSQLHKEWAAISGHESPDYTGPFGGSSHDEWADEIAARLPKPKPRPFVAGSFNGSVRDDAEAVVIKLDNDTTEYEDAGEGFVRIVDDGGDVAVLDVRALAEIVGLRVASTLPFG